MINLIVSRYTEYNLNVPVEAWSKGSWYSCVMVLYVVIQSHDTDGPLFTKKAVTSILLVEECLTDRVDILFPLWLK